MEVDIVANTIATHTRCEVHQANPNEECYQQRSPLVEPQAFTSVCTKELCDVRDDIGRYSNDTAEVFGISVDSVFTLKKYKEEQHYNFPLLSDFNKEVSAAYDTLYAEWILGMKGVSKRSAFVIDKEGIVRYAEVLDSANDVPDFSAISQILADLG